MRKLIVYFWLIISLIAISRADDLDRAIDLLSRGKNDEAISVLESIKLDKNNAKDLYYHKGLAYLYVNKLENAIDNFTNLLRIDTINIDAYNNRGLCYFYMSSFDAAMRDFNKAISLDKKFPQAYLNRANVFLSKNEMDNAKKDLDLAIKYDKNNPEAFYLLGRYYYYKNNFKEAIKNYSNSLKLGLKSYKIYYNRGNAYFKNNQLQEAIKDYTTAINLNPQDLDALNNRSFVYKQMGKDSLAELDRATIKRMKDELYEPIENLVFREYTNGEKDLTLQLPENWNIIELPISQGVHQFIITPESISSDGNSMLVGVTIGVMKNISSKFDVKNESQILDFWKGSLDESNKDYHLYKVNWQRHNQWFGHGSILNQSLLQAGEQYMPFVLYEYAIAYGDNLIFIYMQAPEHSFEYYRQIYDKALQTIKIGDHIKVDYN